MSFNIALSGLSAAHKRLEVAGNNIANVGTVGFKSSRAEFSALYSSARLGNGRDAVGDGVRLANVSQNFTAGDVFSSHGHPLDMRIQGNGFFVVSDRGAVSYTRAGAFVKDANDFIVDSHGNRLQGYGVNSQGEIVPGVRTDLKIDMSNMAPRATSEVRQVINLGSATPSLATLPLFNPADSSTYTKVITRTIQDAGVPAVPEVVNGSGIVITPARPAVPPVDHELKQYFVKTDDDQWSVYVTVDGVSPTDPASPTPLQWSLTRRPDGTLVYTGGSQHVRKISDTEFSLTRWVPAQQKGGAWVPGPAASGGPVSLPLSHGGVDGVDGGDPVMDRPVPVFSPRDATSYNQTFSSRIFDTQGNEHQLRQFFVKDGTNSWRMHLLINDRNPMDPQRTEPYTASFMFNADGSLSSMAGGPGLQLDNQTLTLTGWMPARLVDADKSTARWVSNGALASPEGIRIDMSRLSQHNAETARSSLQVDGYSPGQLSGMNIDTSGTIRASFSNGLYRDIGRVMLASFANEQGLQPQSDTRWTETIESGAAIYDSPGVGSLGSIIEQSLEGSNVRLTEELIELIQAQTAYQANSKVISTEGTLMQTIIQAT